MTSTFSSCMVNAIKYVQKCLWVTKCLPTWQNNVNKFLKEKKGNGKLMESYWKYLWQLIVAWGSSRTVLGWFDSFTFVTALWICAAIFFLQKNLVCKSSSMSWLSMRPSRLWIWMNTFQQYNIADFICIVIPNRKMVVVLVFF